MADPYLGEIDVANSTCKENGCVAPHLARGWCSKHYKRWRKHGDPAYVRPLSDDSSSLCTVVDCNANARKAGLCGAHHHRKVRYGNPLGGGKTRPRTDPQTRFWCQVDVGHPLGCWQWMGRTARGYGCFAIQFEGRRRTYGAHRYAYESLRGDIPDGLHLDHLCRNTLCVNPDHLEAVTPRENAWRSESTFVKRRLDTHCQRGHPFDEENTYVVPRTSGGRRCKECARRNRRRREATDRITTR